MASTPLRELLEKLHAELGRTDAVDDRSRELLHAVEGDIREALARSGEQPESLSDRLRETIERFEGTHPALTEAVSRVLDALVKMGI
jgi:predicted component of type VI protein secretion system